MNSKIKEESGYNLNLDSQRTIYQYEVMQHDNVGFSLGVELTCHAQLLF